MIFTPTPITGVFVIDLEPHTDQRGFFARAWCEREFHDYGLNPRLVQCNVSWNQCRGTLRGMHYQQAPWAETKVVRCIHGALYDVVVDIRPDSPTYKQSWGVELTATNRKALYIPDGCAHGFLTLAEHTEVFYHMSEYFQPDAARGFRWNDPTFSIHWPADISVISERDRTYPDFRDSVCTHTT
jgi:dTDP-4-dehydrorhamnose 3,5-epimerase